mmetsp:Transcript_17206/g.37127  ORF Transcript_17206/g.37127 Transcript_17206/m.37127 type:complete len:259 (+) Transcript_17206:2510-3286(+)
MRRRKIQSAQQQVAREDFHSARQHQHRSRRIREEHPYLDFHLVHHQHRRRRMKQLRQNHQAKRPCFRLAREDQLHRCRYLRAMAPRPPLPVHPDFHLGQGPRRHHPSQQVVHRRLQAHPALLSEVIQRMEVLHRRQLRHPLPLEQEPPRLLLQLHPRARPVLCLGLHQRHHPRRQLVPVRLLQRRHLHSEHLPHRRLHQHLGVQHLALVPLAGLLHHCPRLHPLRIHHLLAPASRLVQRDLRPLPLHRLVALVQHRPQ